MISLEVIQGVSRGLCRSFDQGEITIGRGSEADFQLDPEDRYVGRGVHCRVLTTDGGETTRRIRNEHGNKVFLRSEELEVALERGDEFRFRTPACIEFAGGGTSIWIRSDDDPEQSRTRTLLERSWHGDDDALDELLREHMDWIRRRVRARLGEGLRNRVDSMDLAQEAAIKFLKYGPRFITSEPEKFRALMCKVVENAIRDENDRWGAQKRDYKKDRPVRYDSGISLDPPREEGETPSVIAIRHEKEELLQLALSLLAPDDRRILELRELKQMSFPEIGEALDISPDSARMRHKRALPRLRETLERLRRGDIDESIGSG